MGAQSLGRQEYPNCDELTDRQQTVYFIIIDYVSYLCDDSVGGGELGAEKKLNFNLRKYKQGTDPCFIDSMKVVLTCSACLHCCRG